MNSFWSVSGQRLPFPFVQHFPNKAYLVETLIMFFTITETRDSTNLLIGGNRLMIDFPQSVKFKLNLICSIVYRVTFHGQAGWQPSYIPVLPD
jgi:hypothetical protein